MHTDAHMPVDRNTPQDAQDKRATRITVTLPSEHYQVLLRMAKNKRVSASWVVRDAVEKYLAADMPLFRQSSHAPSNKQ
jgi:hypothetical protein